MFSLDNDRRPAIDKPIVTRLYMDITRGLQLAGHGNIALRATFDRFRVDPVEFGADIPPACSNEDLLAGIGYKADGRTGDLEELIEYNKYSKVINNFIANIIECDNDTINILNYIFEQN